MLAPLFAAALALQAPVVPEGEYTVCSLADAGSLTGAAPRGWGISFHEIPNYTFLDQPGQYALEGFKVVWKSGILAGKKPGDYFPDEKTVRFNPAGVVPVPIATVMSCALAGNVSRETSDLPAAP